MTAPDAAHAKLCEDQPARGPRRAVWLRVLAGVVSLSVLYLVLRQTAWATLWGSLRLVDPGWFVAALVGSVANVLVQAYRWGLCLTADSRPSLARRVQLLFASLIFNNLGLGVLGGDVYRTVRIARAHGAARSVFSVALPRFTNLVSAAMLPALCAAMAWSLFAQNPWFEVVFWVSLASWPAALLFVLLPLYRGRIANRLQRRGWVRPARGLRSAIFTGANLLALLGSALLFQVVAVLMHLFIARALGLPLGLKEVLIVGPCTMLLTSLPITINGIGVREACYVIGFGFFGVSEPQALAFSAVIYVCQTLIMLIGGGVLLAERFQRGEPTAV